MLVGGKPLIAHTIGAARRARRLCRVIVSTDDEAISEVACRHGAEVIMRPADLARADSPIDDAYRHVLRCLADREGWVPDIVVGMQANMPVRRDGEIDEVVERLTACAPATAVATAKRVSERPEWMKRVVNPTIGEVMPVVDSGTSYRVQDLPELFLLDGAVIAVRAAVLQQAVGNRRTHAYCGERVVVHVHPRRYAIEIDDWDDVEMAEFFLSRAPA